MARNDIVLLDSLVEKSRARFGQQLDLSETFELFCLDQILKDYDPSYEDLESGWTDGPEDGGIDAIYVYVDGKLAADDVTDYASRREPEVRLEIFTVKHSDSFQQEPLNSLTTSLADLLDLRKSLEGLAYPFAPAVRIQRQRFYDTFVALADRRPRLTIGVHYCCRGDTANLADNLRQRAEQLRSTVSSFFSDATVHFDFHGAAELLERARQQPSYSLRLRFSESYISREGRNYVVLATLPDYFEFVSDERGDLRRYLFDSNVRDYLGPVQVNEDISASLCRDVGPDVEDFWWLNNGVTILATHATVVGKEIHLENVQIVNGLQTTEAIYRHFHLRNHHDDSRALLLKIILTSDDSSRARIIKATNYQNAVDLASLRGLDKTQQDIEQFLADHGWFYDRRKNYYKNQGRPADRIVSIPYLAAAVRAIALGEPARSQRQRSRSLRDEVFYRQVFNPHWDLRVYLAALQITHGVETALLTRRRTHDAPPIALVHFVGYVYACSMLRKARYKPEEVAVLAGSEPHESDVFAIRDHLQEAAHQFRADSRRIQGIWLSREFIDRFVGERFGRIGTHRAALMASGSAATDTTGVDPSVQDRFAQEASRVTLAVAKVHEAPTSSERVTAGYAVLKAIIDSESAPAGPRPPFKQSILQIAEERGVGRDTAERMLKRIFVVRGQLRRADTNPSDAEVGAYLKSIARLLEEFDHGDAASSLRELAGVGSHRTNRSFMIETPTGVLEWPPDVVTSENVAAALTHVSSLPEPARKILAAWSVLTTVLQMTSGSLIALLPIKKAIVNTAVSKNLDRHETVRILRFLTTLRKQVVRAGYEPSPDEASWYLTNVAECLRILGYPSSAASGSVRAAMSEQSVEEDRDEELRHYARLLSKLVKETKVAHRTGLLNSYERRIVHLVVAEDDELRSEGIGDGPLKDLIISLKAP